MPLVKTQMCPTFRAPVSRPGADSRRECWEARTPDGLWRMDRHEGVSRFTRWTVTFVPWNLVVAYEPSLKECQKSVEGGGWIVQDGEAPWEPRHPEATCWAVRWKGDRVQRAQGTDRRDLTEWAISKIE